MSFELQVEEERRKRLKAEEREKRLLVGDQGTVAAIQGEKLQEKEEEIAKLEVEKEQQVRANKEQVCVSRLLIGVAHVNFYAILCFDHAQCVLYPAGRIARSQGRVREEDARGKAGVRGTAEGRDGGKGTRKGGAGTRAGTSRFDFVARVVS